MKATAIAPSNIAFIKYWGKKDEGLRIPANGSISMNLSNLTTVTTVEFSDKLSEDLIIINKQKQQDKKNRVTEHLNRIRKIAGIKNFAKVVSLNNFPTSTGLSSSASGFAALTMAATTASCLALNQKELSILARLASGSACRSISDGFVEWLDGETNKLSYAVSIYPSDWWDIVDIVTIVSTDKKEVSTTEGQKFAFTSLFYPVRLANIKNKIIKLKNYLKERNFPKFGELVEAEALELHTIMLTSTPSLIYWFPATLNIMRLVRQWRKEGLPVYFTINTGQDIHLVCEKKNVDAVCGRLSKIESVRKIIINTPSEGARIIDNHLF